MKVKLVGYTQAAEEFKESFASAKDLIAFCARVSNPSNQFNNDTADKLLKYLLKHKHFSPFEMASATVEIETTRDIARQILRHRSFAFQEFCVTGDTLITLELPSGVKNSKRSAYKRSIEHLYNLQLKGSLPKYVRVFDEKSKVFTAVGIKEVFCTGIKPVFKLTLANGKSITATKEHKFFTQDGFQTMGEAVGLFMSNDTAAMRKKSFLACNGIAVHQDKAWLSARKEEAIASGEGLNYIADAAEVSTHTIRKWLKVHKLQFTKQEVASYTIAWNKGAYGYNLPKHSMETIEKMRKSARKGNESNLWRGGVDRSERQKIADWCTSLRSEFLQSVDYKCKRCSSNEKLEMHHVKTVAEYPEFAYNKDNIEVLCKKCHKEHHGLNGDCKIWREKSKGNTLTVEWSEVVSVKYMGEQMTYDMEVDHVSHNYIGNGILTHNSQRYADPVKDLAFVLRDARLQDTKNRQNSITLDMQNDAHRKIAFQWEVQQKRVIEASSEAYKWAIAHGIAKEQARAVLPEGNTMSRLYMQGTIRSFIHYIEVRKDESTQAEHREIALAVAQAISKVFNLEGL